MRSVRPNALRAPLMLGAATGAILAVTSFPAFAQSDDTAAVAATTGASSTSGEEAIVVTGSRIPRPNIESTVPVTTLQGEEFFESGGVSVGDIINDLPAARSTFSQSNSTRGIGVAGLNLLDLRGLGTVRTLVLVNGRRHVAGDILSSGVSVDTNTIPADLIERVDVVTGGNSAIYGSDAIAGVVNFVMKRDFDGLQLRGQGGVSKYGDAGSIFASATGGRNFADDRGNLAVSLEYARQQEYFGSGRPYLRDNDAYIVVDTDPAGSVNGSDGIPDRLYFRNVQSATTNNTGLFFTGGNARLSCGADAAGALFNCPYMFRPDGTLAPITGTRIGIAPNGSFTNSDGESFLGGNQFQLAPNLERMQGNLFGHYEFSDAAEAFVEAKYSRTEVSGTGNRGPSFIPSATFLGDTRLNPRLDNPFLTTQARTLITQLLTQSNGAASAANARFNFREALLNLGERRENFVRETWRGVAGLRGRFNGDWTYELSANYGEFKERNLITGVIDRQKFLFAIDAARDPASNQIVCRAQFDPAARTGYAGATDFPNAVRIASDIAACVPVNPFGGQFTPAQADYLLTDTTSVGKITQFVANAFVTGNTGQLLTLPGGPIGFALGGEYRRETNFYQADPQVEANYLFYNALPTFRAPALKVKEAFGEVRLPLLADRPFFQELTASAAARYADYSGSTGGVFAWNAGGEWAPSRDIRFRANYSRAVRAPNLSELYSAIGQNFAPSTFTDPCALRNVGQGSLNRSANCRALGVPAAFDYTYTQSLLIRSGGNPDLTEETSDSYTAGVVLTPRFVPGLSLSVDYYDITVNNVIAAATAQVIVNQCVDLGDVNNVFCTLFQRAGAGGGPSGEQQGRIVEGSLLQSQLNFAKLTARGIDAELNYERRIEGVGKLTVGLQYTHQLENNQFLNPAEPNRADVQLLELGTPEDEFLLRTSLESGPVTFGYRMRYIGKQLLGAYENIFTVQGRAPENADFADRKYYRETFIHDVRLDIEASPKFNFYLGVENVLNTPPPLDLTGIGAGGGIFDNRGRYFYAGAIAKF